MQSYLNTVSCTEPYDLYGAFTYSKRAGIKRGGKRMIQVSDRLPAVKAHGRATLADLRTTGTGRKKSSPACAETPVCHNSVVGKTPNLPSKGDVRTTCESEIVLR